MKITGIDCHILLVPDLDTGATSSAQDDIVVLVHTDEGITGIGETDVNPWIARACIEAPSAAAPCAEIGNPSVAISDSAAETCTAA